MRARPTITHPSITQRSLIPAFLIAIGMLILGPPAPVDEPFSRFQVWGAFLVFWGWAFSLFAWGHLIRGAVLPSAEFEAPDRSPFRLVWLDLAVGTAAAFLVAVILGHSGVLGPQLRPLAIGTAMLGPILAGWREGAPHSKLLRPKLMRAARERWRSLNWPERVAIGSIVVLLVLRMFHGFRIASHGDPYIYELMAPRVWFETGKIWVPPHLPYIAQAGSWNYLYLWNFLLLGGRPGEGLIAVQHFSQWSHLILGMGGSALALHAVLTGLGVGSRWKWLGILGALTLPELRDVATLVKGDWGTIFWATSGVALLLVTKKRSLRATAAIGAFFGLAFTAKFTSAYFLITVMALAIVSAGP